MLQSDGRPLLAHLEQVEERTGKRPPALDVEEIPAWALHVYDTWREIGAGRGPGLMGPARLTWTDLAAWQRLMGAALEPLEARIIFHLDRAWIEERGKDAPPPKSRNPPSANPRARTRQ